MNLIDCVVVAVISEPKWEYNRWWVEVKYNGYGVISYHQLMFMNIEDAKAVSVGYKFLA